MPSVFVLRDHDTTGFADGLSESACRRHVFTGVVWRFSRKDGDIGPVSVFFCRSKEDGVHMSPLPARDWAAGAGQPHRQFPAQERRPAASSASREPSGPFIATNRPPGRTKGQTVFTEHRQRGDGARRRDVKALPQLGPAASFLCPARAQASPECPRRRTAPLRKPGAY